jgi:hypothetical protein
MPRARLDPKGLENTERPENGYISEHQKIDGARTQAIPLLEPPLSERQGDGDPEAYVGYFDGVTKSFTRIKQIVGARASLGDRGRVGDGSREVRWDPRPGR